MKLVNYDPLTRCTVCSSLQALKSKVAFSERGIYLSFYEY